MSTRKRKEPGSMKRKRGKNGAVGRREEKVLFLKETEDYRLWKEGPSDGGMWGGKKRRNVGRKTRGKLTSIPRLSGPKGGGYSHRKVDGTGVYVHDHKISESRERLENFFPQGGKKGRGEL